MPNAYRRHVTVGDHSNSHATSSIVKNTLDTSNKTENMGQRMISGNTMNFSAGVHTNSTIKAGTVGSIIAVSEAKSKN
jgi:hypothetical protein